MKRIVPLVLIASTLLPSCGGIDESSPAPDPAGTVTINLVNSPGTNFYVLYQGLAADGPYFFTWDPGAPYPYVRLRFEFLVAAQTTLFESDASPSSTFVYGDYDVARDSGGEAADVGPVDGLGDVTAKPGVGYSNQAAILKGHGYVVRSRQSRDVTNSALPYYYHRVYVEDWMTSAVTGGVTGVRVKIQGPF